MARWAFVIQIAFYNLRFLWVTVVTLSALLSASGSGRKTPRCLTMTHLAIRANCRTIAHLALCVITHKSGCYKSGVFGGQNGITSSNRQSLRIRRKNDETTHRTGRTIQATANGKLRAVACPFEQRHSNGTATENRRRTNS